MDSVSSADNNNQTNSTQDHNTMAEPSTSDAVVQEQQKSQDYEDLFPKLPGAAPTGISGMYLFCCLFTFFNYFFLHFF